MIDMTISKAYCLADIRSDANDMEAARAINFCAHMAEQRSKWIEKLAWALRQKNARKRENVLQLVLMEMEAQDEPTHKLPNKHY